MAENLTWVHTNLTTRETLQGYCFSNLFSLDWSGEKIYSAIVDLAVDMRAYIETEKKDEASIF